MSDTQSDEKQAAQASEKQHADQDSSAKHAPESSTNKQKKPKHATARSSWGWRFLSLLILIAVAGAGYWYGYLPQQDLAAQVEDLQKQLNNLGSDIRDTDLDLAQVQDTLADADVMIDSRLQSGLGGLQNEILAMAQRLRQVESSRSGDWVIAEVQYLVRLASQKLLVSRDTLSAAQLLREADQLLFELGYPEARPARAALASDVLRIEAIDQIDYQGIYFRLSGLIRLVGDMPLPEIQSIAEDPAAEEENPSGWRGWWRSLLRQLDRFVIIRSADSTQGRMLGSAQAALEKTRIQVLLHEAQLALLSGQQDIYRDSLNQAAQLSESFFATGNNRGNLIRQLDVLAAEPVTLDAPDIAQSLRAVEQLTETLRSANSGGNN